nr:MAG: hypothetical protein [Molluscum contagiosum virus]
MSTNWHLLLLVQCAEQSLHVCPRAERDARHSRFVSASFSRRTKHADAVSRKEADSFLRRAAAGMLPRLVRETCAACTREKIPPSNHHAWPPLACTTCTRRRSGARRASKRSSRAGCARSCATRTSSTTTRTAGSPPLPRGAAALRTWTLPTITRSRWGCCVSSSSCSRCTAGRRYSTCRA